MSQYDSMLAMHVDAFNEAGRRFGLEFELAAFKDYIPDKSIIMCSAK